MDRKLRRKMKKKAARENRLKAREERQKRKV